MKVIMFYNTYVEELNQEVQVWLDENPNITIHFVTQSECADYHDEFPDDPGINHTYSIMYSEGPQKEPK